MTARSGEHGMALVVTLIFTTAMAAAAVAFLAGRQSDALSLRGQLQAVEAQAMLDAALQQTVVVLANRTERQIVPPELRWRFEDVMVTVRLEKETGKVDLNKAEEPILRGLALAVGLDEDRAAGLADVLQDWRDDNQLKRPLGAEDRDYRGDAALSSGAADRPLANASELRYLPLVDSATWALLAPLVTVYSGAPEPDARQAPATVRKAIEIARGLPKPEPADEPRRDATAEERATGAGFGEGDQQPVKKEDAVTAGRLQAGSSQASTLSRRQTPAERQRDAATGRGSAEPGTEGTADDQTGAQTVLLNVQFANGYQAAAKAVIALSADAAGGQPFTVLSWTPILRERAGRS